MLGKGGKKKRRLSGKKKVPFGFWVFIAVMVLVASYLWVLDLSRPHVQGRSIRLDTFVDLVDQGSVKDATLLDVDGFVIGHYLDEKGALRLYHTPYLKGDVGFFTQLLLENRVPTTVDQQNGKRVALLASTLLPFLIITMLFVYLIISYRRGSGLFGIKSGARKLEAGETNVTFADVAGQKAAVGELREIVEFLKEPERFSEVGAIVPKGVLLYGPPGCGKTLIARALAGEGGANFFTISGSDFVELYVGVGASRVRELFKTARENAPAVIFIDEIDSIGRARGVVGTSPSHGEQETALNQLLAQMDGFSNSEGIIVLGATNRPDILDQALLRPGRFDRTVGLERPDEDDRLEILTLHAKNKKLAPEVDLKKIAKKAIGMTGADLASVVNEGALLAARDRRETISQENLEQAVKRIIEAPERQRRLSTRERGIGKRFSAEDRVTFADVAGQEAAVEELKEIQQYLADPDRYAAVGASVPKGVLLYGAPGCGKTLLARALAGESNAAFYSVSASEFVEVFVGQGAARIRDLFAEARGRPPAIIFIDEIDAIGGRRGSHHLIHDGGERDQTLNQLLAEMDGFQSAQGVIVVGATNRPDALDPALLRPGRFDRTIGMERPDEHGRLEILKVHQKDKPLDSGADLAAIARRAIGLSGADLESIMNEAALLAGRVGKQFISQDDLEAALDRILAAPDRQRRLSMRDRSIGRRFTGPADKVTFADVAGVDEAIEELREITEYLAEPERFAELGARVPRGVLLIGPPGCGKTLLARAVAGEANAAFFSVAAPEFREVFVGEGGAKVRDLFAEAKSVAPAIIFVDELDAIGGHRHGHGFDSGDRENTLNQILVELDGFDARSGVILMAATNRPDMLDAALVRPGRIDRQVTISEPDQKGRVQILEIHAKGKRLAEDVDLGAVAKLTQGFSGADLANVMNEATLLAARARRQEVTAADIQEAIERTMMGVGRAVVMSDEERKMVAFHEAGHALVAHCLPEARVPHKITIVSRGAALGMVWHVDEANSDRTIYTRSRLIDQMAVSLGGRVAEEMIFGEPGSGASSDLAKVRETARRMVVEWGMSETLGPLTFKESPERAFNGGGREYSEEGARLIDQEVRKFIVDAHERARTVLLRERSSLDRVAEALLERETLTGEEFTALVGTTPLKKQRKDDGAAAGEAVVND